MGARTRTRARWWGVVAGLATAGPASAQPPTPPAPASIEIYHGTTRVLPAPVPEPQPEPAPVVPAAASVPVAPDPTPALPAPAPEPTRTPHVPQTVVVIREPAAAAPPQVVVVKEPVAPALAATADAKEWVIAGCAGASVALLGVVALRRPRVVVPSAPAAPAAAPVAPPPEEPKPPVRLIGGYDAGPAPATAQKFDLGPSYHEARQEKERTEEQSGAAVLEFVLQQNLALREQLAAEPAAPPSPAPSSPAAPGAGAVDPRPGSAGLGVVRPGEGAAVQSLFSSPVPADEFAAWVEASKSRAR